MLNLMPAIPGTSLYQHFFNKDIKITASEDGESFLLPSGEEADMRLEMSEEPREGAEIVE